MKREEAIDIIKSECYVFSPLNFDRSTRINTALDMAIKALEQESCEDAISKADVFRIMGNLMSIPYDLDRPINKKDVSESMNEVKALPSVTPTHKVGKWLKSNIDGAKVCSICQTHMGLSNFKFCPNCGAKMLEPQESEE